MANQSIPPLTVPPLVNKGLIAGLMKRNLWSIRPYISGGGGGLRWRSVGRPVISEGWTGVLGEPK